METVVPKLVAEDIPLLYSLLSDVFPGVQYQPAEMTALRREIQKVCRERYLIYGEQDELGSQWVSKVKPSEQKQLCEKKLLLCFIVVRAIYFKTPNV